MNCKCYSKRKERNVTKNNKIVQKNPITISNSVMQTQKYVYTPNSTKTNSCIIM